MRFLSFILAVGLILPLMIEMAKAQDESENYSIKHLKTIKQNFGSNYYSYNFIVYPGEKTIDSIKIAVISDIEIRHASMEDDISQPYWISFGVMIYANDPENIRTEIADIKIKN